METMVLSPLQKGTSVNERPSTADERSLINNERPTTVDERPLIENQPITTVDERFTTENDQFVSAQENYTKANKIPNKLDANFINVYECNKVMDETHVDDRQTIIHVNVTIDCHTNNDEVDTTHLHFNDEDDTTVLPLNDEHQATINKQKLNLRDSINEQEQTKREEKFKMDQKKQEDTDNNSVFFPDNILTFPKEERQRIISNRRRMDMATREILDEELAKQRLLPPNTNMVLEIKYVGKIWYAYINEFLLASHHVNEAAIFYAEKRSLVASSNGFSIQSAELDHVIKCLNDLQLAQKKGVTINDRHYKTVLADGRRGLMAKGDSKDGCSACLTRTLVIIGLHDITSCARRCNEEVMRLGDFLWLKGL